MNDTRMSSSNHFLALSCSSASLEIMLYPIGGASKGTGIDTIFGCRDSSPDERNENRQLLCSIIASPIERESTGALKVLFSSRDCNVVSRPSDFLSISIKRMCGYFSHELILQSSRMG